MQDFRNLQVWRAAHELTLTVYRETQAFPKQELFGLSAQMRRCSASIGSNIAEGCGRGGDADFARFLQIAMGSACELEYQIELSRDLRYLDEKVYAAATRDVAEVKRMLATLLRKVRSDTPHRKAAES